MCAFGCLQDSNQELKKKKKALCHFVKSEIIYLIGSNTKTKLKKKEKKLLLGKRTFQSTYICIFINVNLNVLRLQGDIRKIDIFLLKKLI